jgi:dolichyl-phosphate-mannose-protein mannosyltransferase
MLQLQPGSPPNRSTIPWFGWTLLTACLFYNLAVAAIGWQNSILETMAFRQAQTALSAHFMLGHRYQFLYETPVFGPPWRIPFEFPLYQWMAAGLATPTGCPLDQAGRAINRAFFLFSLVPCYALLRMLGLSPWSRLVTLCMLLVSPFFLFWSRTFLMESVALFFALSYLACCVSFANNPRVNSWLAALFFGIFAALVKITTFAGPLLLVVFLLVIVVLRWRRGLITRRACVGYCSALALLAIIPTLIAFEWTHLADEQKRQNPIAAGLTSEALSKWNFGSPWQRFEFQTWGCILGRAPLALTPWTPGPDALTYGLPWLMLAATVPGLASSRNRGFLVLCCLAAFIALPFVFTNLYEFHEYYAFATNVYLIGAIGIGLAALHDSGRTGRVTAHVLTATILILAVAGYWQTYVPLQRTNEQGSLPACMAVREQTAASDVILVLGCDWSSEVPYYCQRRALMIPTWDSIDWTGFSRYLALLDDYRIGALVVQHHLPMQGSLFANEEDAAGKIAIAQGALRARGYSLRLCHEDAQFEVYLLRRE